MVPACYRRCFPTSLKSHRSHDIVLLCIFCHQKAHKAAEQLKRSIAREYGVPLQPLTALREQQQQLQQQIGGGGGYGAVAADAPAAAAGGDLGGGGGGVHGLGNRSDAVVSPYSQTEVTSAALAFHARAAAIALHRFGDRIPQGRRRELVATLKTYLGRAAGCDQECGVCEKCEITSDELETGLLIGLGPKKRLKMLRKLRGKKQQRRQEEEVGEEGGGEEGGMGEEGEEMVGEGGGSEGDGEEEGEALQEDVGVVAGNGVEGVAGAPGATAGDGGSSISSEKLTHGSSSGVEDVAAAAAAAGATSGNSGSSISSHKVTNGSSSNSSSSRKISYPFTPPPGSLAEEVEEAVKGQSGHQWHGEQVVAAAMAQGGEQALHELVRRFRKCFVDALNPKYLPRSWTVEEIGARQFGEYSVYRREVAAGGGVGEGVGDGEGLMGVGTVVLGGGEVESVAVAAGGGGGVMGRSTLAAAAAGGGGGDVVGLLVPEAATVLAAAEGGVIGRPVPVPVPAAALAVMSRPQMILAGAVDALKKAGDIDVSIFSGVSASDYAYAT